MKHEALHISSDLRLPCRREEPGIALTIQCTFWESYSISANQSGRD